MELDKGKLAALLREAELAHAKYVKEAGKKDENWQSWYAQYIIDKLKGTDYT